ncbi:MAG: threonine synthase [Candidatus Eiseniibacteriota bacterium]
MRWRSTAGRCEPADFETALFHGLAPDGGLYLPERIPELPPAVFAVGLTVAETAFEVTRLFLDDMPGDDLRAICADALNFPIPLVDLEDGVRVLELFHGPTHAFKDVGARLMARLMSWYLRKAGGGAGGDITILVATSGDTGSAVAQAFWRVRGTRVVVLYPKGKVTLLQEKQFTTLGGNVTALAVEGTFDDCQRMAKQTFADGGLRAKVRLTSANSISVGRLLPQTIYYVHAAAALGPDAARALFCTPSGNFGNLCAGVIAKRMGMPCAGFVAATNANDVVPKYLATGTFTPRASVATISNAMDVGNPSNFVRILDLYGGNGAALRREIRGAAFDDDATRGAIREVHARTGYVMDPHTAVGWLGLREVRGARNGPTAGSGADRGPGILLATAHPAKFREEVEPVIGAKIPLPPALAACLERESRAETIPADAAAVRERLLH